MLYHSITLREGSTISNLVVASGVSTFPDAPDIGELFFRSDADVTIRGLYCYIDSRWDRIASSDAITAPSGPVFPATALRGDIFYLKSGTATESLYFYTGSAWVSTASTFNVIGDVAGTLSSTSSTLNLVSVGTAGTYGSVSSVPVITTDTKGRVVNATSTNIGIGADQVISGTLANERVSQSSVTQHQAALQLQETQIVDGSILARVGGNETITGAWSFFNPVSAGTPTQGNHVVTKDYLDNVAAGLSWKTAVRLATTTNITLAGLQIIDGSSVVIGDRVLVKNQTSPNQNGIYVASDGVWTRARDMDGLAPIDEINGAAVFVKEGSTQADTGWTQTSNVTAIGTDPITFVQFSSTGAYQAGTGISLNANVFSLSTLPDVGGGSLVKVSRDVYGRIAGTSPVTSSDLSPLVDGNYVNVAGDTMSGSLSMGSNKITNLATPTVSTDASNKSYTDVADYLNMYPKVGQYVGDNTVPIYSDFKFGLGVWSTAGFSFIDRDSKQVIYYSAGTPLGKVSAFRAYRFSDADSYVFDNNPLSLTFLNPGEFVTRVQNLGTFFITLILASTTAPWNVTRTIIARTNGSSRWQDWTFAYDVSSIQNTDYQATSLVSRAGDPDRILHVRYSPSTNTNVLFVYDGSLNLLRQLTLFSNADVDYTSSNGDTGASITFGYMPNGLNHGFTWNPFTESLHQRSAGYYARTSAAGPVYENPYSVSISWSIPRSWLLTGTGTPVNQIPIKSGAFRYKAYPDATWDTENGGLSNVYGAGGLANTIVTDEYSGNMYLTTRHTWASDIAASAVYRIMSSNGKVYKTLGGNYFTSFINDLGAIAIPDGSAWAKSISANGLSVIGNNISFNGYSVSRGLNVINTTFSTTSFSSNSYSNDTLKLDSAGALVGSQISIPPAISGVYNNIFTGTTVVAGVPTYWFAYPGYVVHTVAATGSVRTWSPTSLTMPVIPSTIGAISGIVIGGNIAWNGSTSSPIFWCVVRAGTALHIAKCVGTTWSIVVSNFASSEIAAGNANRGDSAYHAYFESNNLLTQSGRWLFSLHIPVIGNTVYYIITIDTVSNTQTVDGWNKFSPTTGSPGTYQVADQHGGFGFGFSSTLGYYAAHPTYTRNAAYLSSSKDVRGVGSEYTESQWYTNSANRYEVWISTESATGLVAYVAEYPIFLGGYYCKVPTSSISLQPSTLNYVYAVKDANNRNLVNLSASTMLLPNSFSRMLLAAITTNATNIVSSTTYAFDGIGLPAQLGNAGAVLKTDGSTTFWSSDYVASSGGTMTGNLTIQSTNNVPLTVRGAASNSSNIILQSNQSSGIAYWLTAKTGGTLELGGSGASEPSRGAISIASNGHVTVGAAGPADNRRFGISGVNGNTSTADLTFDSDATYGYIQTYGSKPLRINALGNTVSIAGPVGIGTLTPQAILSLGPTTGIKQLVYDLSTTRHGFGIDMSGASNQLNIFAGISGVGSTNISLGSFNTANGTYTEHLRVARDGLVDMNNGYELGWRSIPMVTSGFIRGACLVITGSTTINTAQPGYVYSVFNNTATSVTLVQGAGVTLRLGGTPASGNRTLLPFGLATFVFIDASTAVINGNVT